jgi:alpha-L-arabinofuranosidase
MTTRSLHFRNKIKSDKSSQEGKMDRRKFIAATGAVSAGHILAGGSSFASSAKSMSASVTVEPEAMHDLPFEQYGHFIEHIGKCIKGGIWAEGESDDMFLGGVRHELMDAIKSINPALVRYPGGCFADAYHWKDGIGPRSQRPLLPNIH